ncbi:MAG: NFACT RNA binding domain-containing protein [Candidatus Micrarchaeota archaeon]|nr:NFACT RNA binding domain-containing protein [Candidatus Micrarchaeota archaeon]
MDIIIDPNKDIYGNANTYFENSKKLRKKLEDTKAAIEKTKREIKQEEETIKKEKVEIDKGAKSEKKEWYCQYHWFFTTDGFLAIGGKSAGQNEEIVKRHLEHKDLFFHADIVGAPAVVLKNGLGAPDSSIEQAAQFAACYSSAWKTGYSSVDVYYVTKEQVSKSPPSGEYLQKGSFFISGRKNYIRGVALKLLIGVNEERKLLCLPEKAGIEKFKNCFVIEPGRYSKELVAEKISKQLGVKKDEILPLIPTGNSSFSRLK